ncbi:MAG: hypothetical protein KIS94_06105 [Chitinophagales bacterium]|nr:hypothetical protein [Chitinophagales bacterium]
MLKKSIALFTVSILAFVLFFVPVKFKGSYMGLKSKPVEVSALSFKPVWSAALTGNATIADGNRTIEGENAISIFFLVLIPVYIALVIFTIHYLLIPGGLLSKTTT